MDGDKFPAMIHALLTMTTFHPNRVALVDGDRYEVDRPNIHQLSGRRYLA
jgi:hypothetical protein